ncbi:hypothetical protein CAK95_24380 [Pseudorhodoplanes sinuspersici]|uniref:Bacteriophage tail tape measure C-terminal domain-containing protein n=1 Tax=Pseudorhodoplanes sinuspersici TaxID=1235591 RepID=A0A1W6ZWX1_9HYPH|nr:hypothetical protein CAK95_24380 [Pseudorhodoplanes sinuspersici]
MGADTAALDKGLKDAQGSLSRFAGSMKSVGLVMAGAFAGVAGGVAAAVKSSLNEADKLGKIAQSVGVPVKELSKLKYAADLSDISLESLSTSMVRLSKSMSEVAGGAKGPASEAFRALGISVRNTDGTMKTSSQIMSEVADKFAGYSDGANKTALAVALFGRAGAAMIPMLNGGSAALEEAKREAEELGLVIDSKTSKAAEEFNDNLTRLGKVGAGVTTQFAAHLAPSLAQVSTEMVKVAKDAQFLNQASVGLEIGTKALASTVLVAVYAYKQFATVIGTAVEAALKIGNSDFSGALETIKTGIDAVRTTAVETVDSFRALWSPPDTTGIVAGFDAYIGKAKEAHAVTMAFLEGQKKDAPAIGTGSKDALQSFLDGQQKAIASRNAEAAAVGLAAGEMEKLKVQQQAELIAKQNNITLTDALNAKIAATGEAAAAAALRLQGANLTEEMLMPWESFNQKLDRNRQLFEAGAISAETYARANKKVAEDANADWAAAGQSISGSFQQIGNSFAKESKSMAMVAKVAGVIQSTISMFTGAAKALELPFPANLAAMAQVLATGAGIVASIKSTKTTGFKTGGSFTVPGSGGQDSKRVALDLTPGEQVDIWRPGEGGRDPRGGSNGGVMEVTVNLVGEVFNKETYRKMIDGLNEMSADGYRLKVA